MVSVTSKLTPWQSRNLKNQRNWPFPDTPYLLCVSLGLDSVQGRRSALVLCLFCGPSRPSMHSQESRSCSGYRLLSHNSKRKLVCCGPERRVQLILASNNPLDVSVTVDRPNRFTYGPAVNSDCLSYFDSGISTSLRKKSCCP